MLKDVRYAARTLLQAKAWTAVVVISLALGIGANTALFSAVNGLLLRTLAVDDPDTLVRLRWAGRNEMVTNSSDYGFTARDAAGQTIRTTFSYPMFQQFRADNRTMTDLFACAPFGRVNVVDAGAADVASAFISSGNYYRLLGISALLGRTIVPEDDDPAAPGVAVISHRYWRSRFGSDPGAVGRVLQINNVPVTLVGVLPAAFNGVQRPGTDPPDIAVPLSLEAQLRTSQALHEATTWWLQVMGRLKPGVTPQQVEGNLGGVFQQTARAGLAAYIASLTDEQRALSYNQNRTAVPRLIADSGSRGIYNANTTDLRALGIISGVVGLVLLIVCANVANLLLSRATARQRELAVRHSIGATRGRLVRQLLTESLLLAFVGGSLGIVVAYWGQQLLPGATGRTASLDWRVLSFAFGVTTLTGVIFGIAPAVRATGIDLNAGRKEGGRGASSARTVLGKLLLVFQVALSLVLLVGAGLFLRTVHNLRRVDVGFRPENILLFRVNPQLNRYDEERIATLYAELLARLAAVPGVRSVSLSHVALLSGAVNTTSIFVQGRAYGPGERNEIHRVVVSPSFFETMGIPLRAGRLFTPRDNQTAPKVVLINEAAARQYFPDQNPIGRRFGTSLEESGQMEIVGVLADAKYDSVREPAPPTMFVPFVQTRAPLVTFALRRAADPLAAVGAVRDAIRQVDPNLPVLDVSTQIEQVERRFVQERTFAQAYSLFGVLAALLASVGLFGLMSYSVARRTNEIGIRMALGARQLEVLGLVMRESMLLVGLGVVAGLVIAYAAGRLVASQLFGLASTDIATQVAATMLMLLVSAVAGYLPARRAARVDPVIALRTE